jgi:chloramphenicol-sensitive protein RarD
LVRKQLGWFRKATGRIKLLFPYLFSSIFLTLNWFTYIWAVNNEYIVEASLGYFINPLIYVLMGVIILKEKLRKFQIISILIAAAGVLFLTIVQGRAPWIALILACSFGLYGYFKKIYSLGPLQGLYLETAIMTLPAILFLALFRTNNNGLTNNADILIVVMLILSGVATSLPLIFFAKAAKNLTLTNLGLLQFIAPTIQFLIGLLVYREAFPLSKFIGFSVVWTALIIYTTENLISARKDIKEFRWI